MVFGITIEKSYCTGCGNCAEACPVTTARRIKAAENGEEESVIKPVLQVKHGVSQLIDEDGCGLCGVCIVACSSGAITIQKVQE